MMLTRVIPQGFQGKRWQIFTVGVLWLLTSSIFSLPTSAQPRTKAASAPTASEPNSLPPETEYVLGPGDGIRLNVFQVAELSGDYLILVDGSLTLPLAGTVQAQGLTLTQLSNLLAQRYAAYLKRPIVTASLLVPRPLKIAIAGEVNNPGSYTLAFEKGQKFPSLTDLIRQAGGITTVADIGQIQIRRSIQGKDQVRTLNLWELLQKGNLDQDITLRDGDSIFIPTQQNLDVAQTRQLAAANFGLEANQEINVVVVGEVYRPGAYKVVPQQATGSNVAVARRQPPRLTLAVQLAGGIKPLADLRDIQIRRYNRDGSQQTVAVNLWELLKTGDIEEDLILQEGDTITIPTAENLASEESESIAAASFSPEQIRVNIVGEVLKPGVVQVPPNTPLNQALMAAGGFDKRRADEGTVELVRLNPNGTVSKRDIKVDFSRGISEENNPPLRNNDVIVVNRSGLAATTDTLNIFLSPLGAALGFVNFFNVFGN